MSSVIKNPMILNSANYIYNWFLAINKQNESLVEKNNMYEMIESDEYMLFKVEEFREKEERYKNIDERLQLAKEKMNE